MGEAVRAEREAIAAVRTGADIADAAIAAAEAAGNRELAGGRA